MRVLASCARGTRALVERECSDLGLPVVHRDGEGVTLELDEAGLARALVHLCPCTHQRFAPAVVSSSQFTSR